MDINQIFGNSKQFSNNTQIKELLNEDEIYIIDGNLIKQFSYRIDDETPYKVSINNKTIIRDNLKKITDTYKKIMYFESEELAYDYESVSYFFDLCMEYGVKLFVYSFNCNINEFLKDYDSHDSIGLNWKMFGTSNEKTYRDEPVTSRFKYCNKNF
jgi:hypothetical protein